MRFIPISHIKQKNYSEVVLPKPIDRLYVPLLLTRASPPAQALAHWGQEGSGAATTASSIEDDQVRSCDSAFWAQS